MTVLIAGMIGLCAGTASGLLGIGGAMLMIPMLIGFLGFSQHLAQGTALATLLLPVGIMAVIVYYKNGNVNVAVALAMAATFLVGGYFGAKWAQHIDPTLLRKGFAVFLVLVAAKLFFK